MPTTNEAANRGPAPPCRFSDHIPALREDSARGADRAGPPRRWLRGPARGLLSTNFELK